MDNTCNTYLAPGIPVHTKLQIIYETEKSANSPGKVNNSLSGWVGEEGVSL